MAQPRPLMAVQNPKAANVKVDELIDARLIRKLDENGYYGQGRGALRVEVAGGFPSAMTAP